MSRKYTSGLVATSLNMSINSLLSMVPLLPSFFIWSNS